MLVSMKKLTYIRINMADMGLKDIWVERDTELCKKKKKKKKMNGLIQLSSESFLKLF